MERNLTTQEVADMFRTSPETVRFWRHIGKGPHSFKVGRRVLYRETDVNAWADAASAPGASISTSRADVLMEAAAEVRRQKPFEGARAQRVLESAARAVEALAARA